MNVHDEMSDNEVLRAAADSLSALPVATPPEVEAIMARGRARRRRRLSAVASVSVAAAAGTALALGLTGVLGPARTPGTIRTVSFTLVSNSDGTATLTINPKELLDPAALQNDLAHYGIPAKVTSGSFCSSDPAPAGHDLRKAGRLGQVPGRRKRVGSPPSRSTRRPCPQAPSSASATSSSARASSRPMSSSSTPAPTPAPAPRLTSPARPRATTNPTAWACCTAAPAPPGRNQARVATALA